MIYKWAKANLDLLNCENVGKYIRKEAKLIIDETYLSEDCDSFGKLLSLIDFLRYLS